MTERQLAVALKYVRAEAAAPEVVAKGRGALADRIIQIARKHGVPVHRDSDLVQVLSKLDVGAKIPPELYEAVAEILAYLYRMNRIAGW